MMKFFLISMASCYGIQSMLEIKMYSYIQDGKKMDFEAYIFPRELHLVDCWYPSQYCVNQVAILHIDRESLTYVGFQM